MMTRQAELTSHLHDQSADQLPSWHGHAVHVHSALSTPKPHYYQYFTHFTFHSNPLPPWAAVVTKAPAEQQSLAGNAMAQ